MDILNLIHKEVKSDEDDESHMVCGIDDGSTHVGLGIFQGKNNSGKSTWDSPHAFFKMTYAA